MVNIESYDSQSQKIVGYRYYEKEFTEKSSNFFYQQHENIAKRSVGLVLVIIDDILIFEKHINKLNRSADSQFNFDLIF